MEFQSSSHVDKGVLGVQLTRPQNIDRRHAPVVETGLNNPVEVRG